MIRLIKKGHSFNIVIDEIFFLQKIEKKIDEVVLCFENDINFVDLLLEQGQLIKNTEKRKLKY